MRNYLKSIGISTIYIVSKISKDDFNHYLRPYFNFYPNEYFAYNYNSKDLTIKFNPKGSDGNVTNLMREHWNLKLEIQNNILSDLPKQINELLLKFDFFINRISVAFDFNSSMGMHFSLVRDKRIINYRHDGTENFLKEAYYLYNDSSRQRALIYDRKKYLRENKNIDIEDNKLLRYRITIKPKLTEQKPIQELEFGYLDKYLDKFVFIPQIKSLKSKNDDILKNTMRRKYKDIANISERKRDRLVREVIDNKFDFTSVFKENTERIFEWSQFNKNNKLDKIS